MAGAGDSDRDEFSPQLRGEGEMPRWVKVFALIGLLVLILVAIMLLTGHGPSQHLSDASAIVPTVVTAT